MRAIFAEHGQTPDAGKLLQYGGSEILIPMRDSPIANKTHAQHYSDAGLDVSLFWAWNWFPPMTGAQFADRCSSEMRSLDWDGSPDQPGGPWAWFDIESLAWLGPEKFVDFTVECLTRWRQIRPKRKAVLTINPFQGGLFNNRPQAVEAIKKTGIPIVIQFYVTMGSDQMYPAAADVATEDLEIYGFPRSMLYGFYDAQKPPMNWNGALWTSARLP